jgi:hypothetical protein
LLQILKFLRKLKIEFSYDPELKVVSPADICTPMFIAALLIIAER